MNAANRAAPSPRLTLARVFNVMMISLSKLIGQAPRDGVMAKR
jgi:hypothetical protein